MNDQQQSEPSLNEALPDDITDVMKAEPTQIEKPKRDPRSWFRIGGIALAIVLVGLVIWLLMRVFAQSPADVLTSFVKASQKRDVVSSEIFLDSQAEQRYAIVYKIPPKSFRVKKTILEENTATVEVEWTTIDSSKGYQERVEDVSFTLTKIDRKWKLNDVKEGNVLDFNFLFGT